FGVGARRPWRRQFRSGGHAADAPNLANAAAVAPWQRTGRTTEGDGGSIRGCRSVARPGGNGLLANPGDGGTGPAFGANLSGSNRRPATPVRRAGSRARCGRGTVVGIACSARTPSGRGGAAGNPGSRSGSDGTRPAVARATVPGACGGDCSRGARRPGAALAACTGRSS